ncbi:hypothetical protein K2173_013259 [Erythroxylum novogranatense]|uniref:Uncharacterized protein n=1 Tax=Erythroxylum novogranatense TaxID=1862640 RepID=A0AAV8TTK9_9ROSI|nr:hypothetical protein K2173_013259 [Erythroxylum novogranatense]
MGSSFHLIMQDKINIFFIDLSKFKRLNENVKSQVQLGDDKQLQIKGKGTFEISIEFDGRADWCIVSSLLQESLPPVLVSKIHRFLQKKSATPNQPPFPSGSWVIWCRFQIGR